MLRYKGKIRSVSSSSIERSDDLNYGSMKLSMKLTVPRVKIYNGVQYFENISPGKGIRVNENTKIRNLITRIERSVVRVNFHNASRYKIYTR